MCDSRVELGKVTLICGPMFSGKTTALITRLNAAVANGVSVSNGVTVSNRVTVLAVKPKGDTRYSVDRIFSHDGAEMESVSIATEAELQTRAGKAQVIGVDEIHFFDPSIAAVCKALADRGAGVICAGVDLDHRGGVFDTVAAIEAVADRVIRLTATCAGCGAQAEFTQRLVNSDARIVLGGVGQYEPRCSNCFERGDASV